MIIECKKHGEQRGILIAKWGTTICQLCAEANMYAEPILVEYKRLQQPNVIPFKQKIG